MASPRYYTYQSQLPGVAQARVVNKKTGQASDRYFFPGDPNTTVGYTRGKGFYVKTLAPTSEKPPSASPQGVPPANPYGLDPRVQPYLAPQLQLIQNEQDAAQAALKSFTQAIISQLQGAPAQAEANYNDILGQQQGLATAAADSLRNSNNTSDLLSILQAAGAPTSQQNEISDQLNRVFSGGAAALQGINGTIPGNGLLSQKAAELDYLRNQPAIQALAGTQAMKNLLFQYGQQRGQVLAQAPQILNELEQQQAQQQQAAADEALKQQQAAADAAYKQQYLGYLGSSLGVKDANQKAQIKIQQQNADTSFAKAEAAAEAAQARIKIQQQNADTSFAKAEAAAEAAQARIKIQQQNANTAAAKLKLSKAQKKLPTASQLNNLVDGWYSGKTVKKQKKQPFPDINGNPVYRTVTVPGTGKLTYQQAYRRLKSFGVPDQQALALLNTRWKRGQSGRPWLSLTERNALKAAGVKPTALYYKRLPYLNSVQAKTLQAAGLLPAGELKQGRYFIAPSY